MVPAARGKHRRPEAELPQVPGRVPSSTTEYLLAPAGATGPDPDWSTDANGVSWPQFNSPPPTLHPDHPSAPVPRVRDPRGPDPGGAVGPRRAPDNSRRPGRLAGGAPRLPQRQPGTRPNPGSPRPRGSSQAWADPRGYAPGQGYTSGQYPSIRAHPPGPAFGPAQAYGPNQGYALDRGYEPAPANPPARGDQAGSGNRRLYGVPYDPRAAGPTGPHPGRGQAVAFSDQPGPFGQAGRRADIRDSGPLWPTGQAPAGQVLTVAEEQAATIKQEAWDQAAAIRQAAEQEAAAIRQTAVREAAELKAALLALSGELGRAAAFVTDNLANPTLPDSRPVALPPPRRAREPDALFAEPLAPPATRPAGRPTTKPGVWPAKPAGRPRQLKAFRVATVAAAGLVVLAIAAGSAEVATNGFRFFVFRQGNTGESAGNETDNQFLARQAAAAHHATPGRQAGATAHKSRHAKGHHAHKTGSAAKTDHTPKTHHK